MYESRTHAPIPRRHFLRRTLRHIFAGVYALYAGLVFLVATGLLLLPVFHRVLHKFHWESAGDK